VIKKSLRKLNKWFSIPCRLENILRGCYWLLILTITYIAFWVTLTIITLNLLWMFGWVFVGAFLLLLIILTAESFEDYLKEFDYENRRV